MAAEYEDDLLRNLRYSCSIILDKTGNAGLPPGNADDGRFGTITLPPLQVDLSRQGATDSERLFPAMHQLRNDAVL